MSPDYGFTETTITTRVPNPPPVRLTWRVGPVTPKQTQPTPGARGVPATGNEDVTVQLTADQQVTLEVSATDAYGNPVTDDLGDITWTSSDESVVTVTPSENPAQVTAVAVGPAGTAAVTVTADPDHDTGTPNFQGSLAVDVVAGDVTELTITAGTPEDKPA